MRCLGANDVHPSAGTPKLRRTQGGLVCCGVRPTSERTCSERVSTVVVRGSILKATGLRNLRRKERGNLRRKQRRKHRRRGEIVTHGVGTLGLPIRAVTRVSNLAERRVRRLWWENSCFPFPVPTLVQLGSYNIVRECSTVCFGNAYDGGSNISFVDIECHSLTLKLPTLVDRFSMIDD